MASDARRGALTRAAVAVGAVLLVACAAGPAAAADNPAPFLISGDLPGILSPGTSLPLDLQLFNPNDGLLAVNSLTVAVDSVIPTGQGTCTVADFAVDNVLPIVPLVVPPGASGLLSQLGLGSLLQPRVRMVETGLNQDGCQGARLRLVYEGSGLTEETDVSNGGGGEGGGGGGKPTPGHGSNDGEVGSGQLPGTGANQDPWWIAFAGLGLGTLGAGALGLTRRSKRGSE